MAIDKWQDKAIPFLLHADKAVFTAKHYQSILSIQFQSLLGSSFADGIYMMSAMPSRIFVKDVTENTIWKAVIHHLNAVFVVGSLTMIRMKNTGRRIVKNPSMRRRSFVMGNIFGMLGLGCRFGLPREFFQDSTL